METAILKQYLQSPFNRTHWQQILYFISGNGKVLSLHLEPKDHTARLTDERSRKYFSKVEELGTLQTSDGETLPIFDVELQETGIAIEHNRVGVNTLLKKIMIQDARKGLLVTFHYPAAIGRNEWRFSFISKSATSDFFAEADTRETNPWKFTYIFGTREEHRTAIDRLFTLYQSSLRVEDFFEAFNVEPVSDKFFEEYYDHFQYFVQYIQGDKDSYTVFETYRLQSFNTNESLEDSIERDIRNFVKRLMGRIVFLYFLQKKHWLGAGDTKYKDGDTNFLQNLFNGIYGETDKDNYYSLCLYPLFFNTLNTPARENDCYLLPNGTSRSIPYLNGGLFDEEHEPEGHQKIKFPARLFEYLFDFFNGYNFTIYENSPTDHTVAVDPEMLGRIFENLLEDNKDKGTYYTPKQVVYYMCQKSLIEYLHQHLPDIEKSKITQIVRDSNIDNIDNKLLKDIEKLIDEVKICDPAIGSGAFPMGLLQEIFNIKALVHYQLGYEVWAPAVIKENIIHNSIHGVDIEIGAIDIARLRFWLSLVVDEPKPRPLPNLDYKIMQGNSLLERFDDIDLSDIMDADIPVVTQQRFDFGEADIFETTVFDPVTRATIKKLLTQFFNPDEWEKTYNEKIDKKAIKKELNNIVEGKIHAKMYIEQQRLKREIKRFKEKYNISEDKDLDRLNKKSPEFKKYLENTNKLDKLNRLEEQLIEFQRKDERPYFLWHMFFFDVFEKGGFDIIIANPPFGAKLSTEEKNIFKELYADVHMRTPDTFNYFISKSYSMLKQGSGVITFIVPNNLLYQNENTATRQLLINDNRLVRVINLGDNVFAKADVPTCIFSGIKKEEVEYNIEYSDNRKEKISEIDYFNAHTLIAKKEMNEVPNFVIGISGSSIKILKDIENVSCRIDDIALEVASGISTGGDKIFRISKEFAEERMFEKEILKPVLVGGDIDKYKINYKNNLLIYSPRNINIDKYPIIKKHLLDSKSKLDKRSETRQGILPWYSLGRQRYPELFEEPKVIMRQTSDQIKATYDYQGFYVLNSILVLKLNKNVNYSTKYVLLLLNSKVNRFVYKSLTQEEGRVFAEVKPQNVRKLYIPIISLEDQKAFEILCDYLLFLNDVNNAPVNQSIDNKTLAYFFEQIADVCVAELIYGKEMETKEVNILKYVRERIEPIEQLEYETQKARIIFYVHYDWSQPESKIRNRLKIINLMCPDTVAKILSDNEEHQQN